MQSRTCNKTYPNIGTPDSCLVFQVGLKDLPLTVVPATGPTLNTYPIVILTYTLIFYINSLTSIVSVNVNLKNIKKGRESVGKH